MIDFNSEGWLSIKETPPEDSKQVYLKCQYMFMQYVTKGSLMEQGKHRETAECDLDIFFRSSILGWKPIEDINEAQQVKIGQIRKGPNMTVLIVGGYENDKFTAIALEDSKFVKRFEWNTWNQSSEIIADVYPEVVNIDFGINL